MVSAYHAHRKPLQWRESKPLLHSLITRTAYEQQEALITTHHRKNRTSTRSITQPVNEGYSGVLEALK